MIFVVLCKGCQRWICPGKLATRTRQAPKELAPRSCIAYIQVLKGFPLYLPESYEEPFGLSLSSKYLYEEVFGSQNPVIEGS